jgi:hypothetical protein
VHGVSRLHRTRRRLRQHHRPVHSRRPDKAATLAQLGRAGFLLAGFSASGLMHDYIPPPPPTPPPEAAAAAATASGGSSEHSSSSSSSAGAGAGVRLVVAGPDATQAQLRELSWLETAAVAGHVNAQLALADR